MEEVRHPIRQKGEENSGRIITAAKLYVTWYEFKKDLENQLGYMLFNWRWLEVKPEAPLPWDESHMQAAVSVLAGLDGHKVAQKRTKNTRLPTGGRRVCTNAVRHRNRRFRQIPREK